MYAKLAIRNVQRSAKDYLIYVVTLILSVGMFYGFFSIVSPYYNDTLPIQIHLEILNKAMRAAVPAVGLLIVFLLSYMNSHMLRRKQKEFAIQTIIGMEQRTVAWIFFLETIIIGAVAIIIGIILGTFVSQIISIIVVRAFTAEYHLHLMLFPDTVLWTVLFFGAIFLLMGIKNIRTVRRMKVIDMLQNDQNGTERLDLHQQLGKWSAAVALVSLAAFGMLLSLIIRVPLTFPARLLIGIAAGTTIGSCLTAVCFFIDARRKKTGYLPLSLMAVCSLVAGILLMTLHPVFESLVRQGLTIQAYVTMPPVIALFLIVFSIVVFFSNLSWLITNTAKRNASFYYGNLFLIGQLKSRFGRGSKTMGIIACVLTASIVLFAWLPIMAIRINSYQLVMSAFDVQVGTMFTASEDALPTGTLDYDFITEYLEQNGYGLTGVVRGELFVVNPEDLNHWEKEYPLLAISLSDYNDLRNLSGLSPLVLKQNEFGVAWNNTALPETIHQFNQSTSFLEVGNTTLDKADNYKDPVGISLFTSRTEAVYIIPDRCCRGLQLATTFYSANTDHPLTFEFAQQFDKEVGAHQRNLGNFPAEQVFVRLHTLQSNEGISNMLLLALAGAYSALVLIVISLTILSVQQLTDAIEQKKRFQIIAKLGVDKSDRNRCIRQQMLFWFGLPVLVALIGSIGTLAFLIRTTYKDIVAYLSMMEVGTICGIVYIAFLTVLLCYFASTYYLFQKNMRLSK